ncbi:MAG: VTT domain-containing protein [Archangium sp.]|nr:VTT domain-containing protein [Archangium sp.]MDP3572961.1 VTT domain-containing protein [Archangium sp.]
MFTEKTCWRRALAHRVAFLVDGANYFDVLASAMQRAKRSIYIVGWDLHSRMELRPQSPDDPCVLVELLHELTERNPALEVRVLTWDPSPILAFEREFLPMLRLSLGAGRRLHLQLAADHPSGATHHQKIVVIDDAVAFVGGLDLTVNRWDERQHRAKDPARVLPNGEPYGPFHDVQVAVDGDAAVALADLARARWWSATGDRLDAPPVDTDPWPSGLEPDLREVQVAFARTQAEWKETPAVREVEALFLAAIASARRCIYIENQYITSLTVRDALVARLREPGGPEVIVLMPNEQSGPLEKLTMGVLRTRVLRALHEADVQGRLRVWCPQVRAGAKSQWVNVHAKVMVIDDRLLIIGSANLCNRSMGLDTECNAAFESEGDDETARAIRAFRDGLVAEHLGVAPSVASQAIDQCGSVVKAIEQLQGGPHTLSPIAIDGEEESGPLVPLAEVVDAEGPVDEALVRQAMPDEAVAESRRNLPRVFIMLGLALALAAAWTWTPLKHVVQPSRLFELATPLRSHPLGPVVWVLVFALASLVMVPLLLLTVVTVMLFGSWVGFITAMAGSMVGALTSYGLGRVLLRDTVRRLTGRRLARLARKLTRRGWLAIVAVRMVPVAPFAIVNMVAGSVRIRPRDFILGTLLGMAPGTLALAADRVVAAARDPTPVTVAVALIVVVLVVLVLLGASKLLERTHRVPPPRPSGAA